MELEKQRQLKEAKFLADGKKVGMVAGDTFRAAAVEQLKIWSNRAKSEFFSAEESSDPAALAYKSVMSAQDKLDILLIDTGRLTIKKILWMSCQK